MRYFYGIWFISLFAVQGMRSMESPDLEQPYSIDDIDGIYRDCVKALSPASTLENILAFPSFYEAMICFVNQPNDQDDSGKTFMHYAAEMDDADKAIAIIDQLIAYNASVLIEDNVGRRPQEYACNARVASYLAHCVDQELLARNYAVEQVKLVCPKAIRPCPQQFCFDDERRETKPLDARLYISELSVMKSLLAQGQADPCGVDGDGRTALHHLVLGRKADKEKVSVLVAAGLNINTRDYEGKTALYYGIILRSEEMVRCLLALRASPFIPDFEENVPAKEKYYKLICEKLWQEAQERHSHAALSKKTYFPYKISPSRKKKYHKKSETLSKYELSR